MDFQPINQTKATFEEYTSTDSSNKNVVIVVLILIVILSLLGINIFSFVGDVLQQFINVFSPLFSNALTGFGRVSGTALNASSNVIADTSKTGIDILNGTVQSVGDLLIKSHDQNKINQPPMVARDPPQPADTTNPIVSAAVANKNKWCLVGEYNGKRGCISITDSDKCMSGQVFPSQQLCLNPNLSK
jgi:hypothetical protein|uniref:Uncharacterized protein n=1 Tax=viral metagenome TaxID=1070528 RepID=A0A6C0DY07_9ZZZZ